MSGRFRPGNARMRDVVLYPRRREPMRRLTRLGCLIATLAGLLGAAAAPAPEPRVEAFSPQGSHKDVRQAQARFNVPMVAFGDPTLADPFDVECQAPGKGRWADARNWVYDFEDDLPGGLRCRFTLKPGVKSQDGRPLAG